MTIVKPTEALGKTPSYIYHLGRHLYEFPKGVIFQEGTANSLKMFLKENKRLIESGYIEVIDSNAKPAKDAKLADMPSPPVEGEHNDSQHNMSTKKENRRN